MAPAPAPTALTISIGQALELLDGSFSALAAGVAQRQYAFWLGSGISRERVDDLKKVVARVLTHMRERLDPIDSACPYHRALDEALGYARLSPRDRATVDYTRPIDQWPAIDTILWNLTSEYARLLDIRIDGHPDEDYLLWDVVDVPRTFAPAATVPDCEHLCLAILVLEGVVADIATANWDGFIEAAVDELTDGSGAALRVCVRSDDLREPPLLARLLKFHGCAVRAGLSPAEYRSMLIARLSQIIDWRNNPDYALMKHELLTLAATKPTLMIGLSAQDTNIQQIFADGQVLMRWQWPCALPAHVFAEDRLGPDQVNILRIVYRAAYAGHRPQVEASALLRAYAKPALTAIVLHILCTKLRTLIHAIDAPRLPAADRSTIESGVLHLRDRLAEHADGDRLRFVRLNCQERARNDVVPDGLHTAASIYSVSPNRYRSHPYDSSRP
jgi:hypothetical protein